VIRYKRPKGFVDICSLLACAGSFEQAGPNTARCTTHGVTYDIAYCKKEKVQNGFVV
jgi:hypothetical protein